jgi:hypothetical protein
MCTTVKFLLLAAVLAPSLVPADGVQDIELVDGSRVRAEVVSLEQGVYRLRSDSLGEIRIPAAEIKSITRRQMGTTASDPTRSHTAQIDSVRDSLIQDPDAMSKIEALQNDPLVKNILNDETTMRAIQAGDLDSLMNDPKIKALMENSTVQEITTGGGL